MELNPGFAAAVEGPDKSCCCSERTERTVDQVMKLATSIVEEQIDRVFSKQTKDEIPLISVWMVCADRL